MPAASSRANSTTRSARSSRSTDRRAGRVKLPRTNGGQYYGLAKIDGRSGALRVQIKDLEGAILYERTLG